MKRISITILAAFCAASMLLAQESWTKARQEIHNNRLLSASNYVAYLDPSPADRLTPAPKGYEPFYLTHYGRHGSRWLTDDNQYKDVINPLRKAHEMGILTEKGQKLLEELVAFHKTTAGRIGELTRVGEDQHHRIGKRMAAHFPEIFGARNSQVDARSTVVIRCILSMEAECEELYRFNKRLRMYNDVSNSFQYYLAPGMPEAVGKLIDRRGDVVSQYRSRWIHPERFCAQLFTDASYLNADEKQRLMRRFFDVCGNMQSHYDGLGLWDFLTEEECYDLWKTYNIDWYTAYGACVSSERKAPLRVQELLRNFISTADTIIGQKDYHGATLRFGHEVFVLPMAALMELGNSGVTVENLDTLDRVWANYRIFCMGSNIQLVFYRPSKGRSGDILVKALLNEREVSLPVPPVEYPYYKWEDLKAYYLKKMNAPL